MTRNLFVVFLIVALAFGMMANAQSITTTKHNLTTSGTGSIKATGANPSDTDLCGFCHTPHAGTATNGPLWNKNTPAGPFTMYGTTIAGTATDATPNPSSMACLSCHDGVSTLNSAINIPGSGLSGTPATMTQNTITAAATNVGTNLQNDHPVSITYTAGKASLRLTTYVISGWLGGATTISGILRSGKVECGTCHDPHNNANLMFLRKANTSSALCIDCHAK